jgi:hypothetical protein
MFSSRWLYALILAIDANFRLKNKCRRIRNDPALGDGWGHWVPEKPYQAYIKKYGYQQEVSVLSLFFKQFNLDIHGLQPSHHCQYFALPYYNCNEDHIAHMPMVVVTSTLHNCAAPGHTTENGSSHTTKTLPPSGT